MQVCNFHGGVRIRKSIFFVIFALFVQTFLFGQNNRLPMPDMPEMPSMPDMPSIGGGFYRPTLPSPKNGQNKNKTETTGENQTKKETVISDAGNTNGLLAGSLGNLGLLSANDISSLYDSGLFDSLSGLSGTSSINSGVNSAATNVILQQILGSLEDLKIEQKKASPEQKEKLQNYQQDSQNFKHREPAVLRFKINGYDIADSLTATFFSVPENDGSFLLTADRKYFANQKARNETFYMLFRTSKSNGSVTTYEVVPTIAQDYLNKNSLVYKLCQKNSIVGEKTGNLVVIHYADGDLSMDMLLDIDNQ